MPAEDAYGTQKRLQFISQIVDEMTPATVLDVGCGSGNLLTRPLAERFPAVRFVGVDTDEGTIRFAQGANVMPNLCFETEMSGEFDLIIASEVLEHVEDPVAFLRSLRNRLSGEAGQVVLTVPNGFGPFELAAAAERIIHGPWLGPLSSAVSRSLRTAKHFLVGAPDFQAAKDRADTFADSPHLNFFSRDDVIAIAAAAGFGIKRQRARTLVCGYGFDRVVKGRLAEWNCRLADAAPSFSSGWMFLLERNDWRAGAYAPGRGAAWRRRPPLARTLPRRDRSAKGPRLAGHGRQPGRYR